MISPSSTHPRLTEEGRRNVFRLNGRDDRQGELAGNFLADHWEDARIAILHDGSTYGEGLAIEARKELRVRGVAETIYQLYTPDADDYTDVVDQLRAAEIDVVYLGGYGPDAGRILRAARERGDDLRLVGGDGVAMDEFWTVADRAGEGTIFSGQRDPSTLPEAVDVLAQFRARGLGTRSGGLAYYAAVEVWAQAVERAQTVKLAAVADMLRAKRFASVLGPVAFDSKGDLRGAGWQWKVWTKGNHVPLTRVEMTQ
jgi:branched-chain amino acid transport system substrate-binding protein